MYIYSCARIVMECDNDKHYNCYICLDILRSLKRIKLLNINMYRILNPYLGI